MSIPGQASVSSKSRIFSRDPVVWTLAVLFFLVTVVFYSTEFRTSLNHYFFDLIGRWIPDKAPSAQTVVIGIDEQSIENLEQDSLRVRRDIQKRPYLGTWALVKAAGILGNTNAKAIVFLMPEHAFPASGLDMTELIEFVRFDQRMFIGTIGFNQRFPNTSVLPAAFLPVEARVAGFETFRTRGTSVVRKLPLTSFRGSKEVLNLPALVGEGARSDRAMKAGELILKSKAPRAFQAIPISDFLAEPKKHMDGFSDKVVIVGYTTARDAGFQTTEQMIVNTPSTGFSISGSNGISHTYLIANAIDNLLTGQYIKEAPGVWVVLQTIIMACICGFSWEWGSVVAAALTLTAWATLMLVLSWLYHAFSLTLPIADTFLASVLISVFGAVRRLRMDLITVAAIAAKKEASVEIAEVQSRFLSGFAVWLQSATKSVMEQLRSSRMTMARDHAGDSNLLFDRAFLAGEDFSEYLESIRQIPEMETRGQAKVRLETVNIEDLLNAIIRRFQAKLKSKNAVINVKFDGDVGTVRANPQLLDAVLFNLISNAVKYGPQGADIDIEIARFGGKTAIRVCDRGPGVADDMKDRVFEKFYRIRDDRMYAAKGSGLGLYMVRFFAESMNAGVIVKDRDGGGSVFEVIL